MPIEPQNDELEPLPPELHAAFRDYPQPSASADFDARFWKELDARKHRYHGFQGFLRRVVEVEIEGIAVWRLGFSLFGGGAFCTLAIALLSLSSSCRPSIVEVPRVAKTNEVPTTAPRFARGAWGDFAPHLEQQSRRATTEKKEIS